MPSLCYLDPMYQAAKIARQNLARHPTFKVGAYLETDSYGISHGNIGHENSMLTMCAERMVLMIAKGDNLTPKHMHLVSDSKEPIFPCGVCRQYMSEFPRLKVTVYSADGQKKITKTANQLLPNPYKRDRL